MFNIDERREPAPPLRLGNEGQRERSFTGRFRPINFDDPTARETTDSKGPVNQDVARGDQLDIHLLGLAKPHDGTVPVILCDLLDREVQIAVASGNELSVV